MTKLETVERKVMSLDKLLSMIKIWQLKDQRIVFTNGCFDLLHLGHVDYLSKAPDLGNQKNVGVNTDASTAKFKGPSRPITDQKSRTSLLASLFFVDAVVLFDEPTPIDLIKAIKPDVLVKGADYTIDKIVGADVVLTNGGEVKTITYIDGYSTTSIESKIRNS